MVTNEGIDVRNQAWQLISGVPRSIFHRKKTEATKRMLARSHGNIGLRKPRQHVEASNCDFEAQNRNCY